MSRELVCRGCLTVSRTSSASPTSPSDYEAYESLVGVPLIPVFGLREHLCSFCSRMLHKFSQFKARCLKVLDVLQHVHMQGEVTNDYTNILNMDYPELKLQYVQTNTLVVDFDSTPINIFKHENRDMITETEITLHKEENVSESDTDIDIHEHSLEDIKNENPYVGLVKPCQVYVRDLNIMPFEKFKIMEIEKKETVKKKRLKKDSKSDTLKKDSKSDTQIVKDYAEATGFYVAFLSHAEQLEEVEERKRENATRRFKCVQCGKCFKDSNVLEKHKKHYHVLKPNSMMCDICSCVFHTKRSLRVHVSGHSFVFSCKKCDFKTKQRSVLRNHQYYHEGKMFSCSYCEKMFDKIATYFSHVRMIHAAELPYCDLCGDFLNSENGVETHKKLSHNIAEEFPNACSDCGKRFQSDAALERHAIVKGCHQPSCVKCGDSFFTEFLLKHHLVQRHYSTTSPEPFDCDKCHTRFYNAPALDRHICDSKAVCVQCGDNFETTHRLMEHFASAHHIFKCEECGQQFTNAAYYKRHYEMKHTERQRPSRGNSDSVTSFAKPRKPRMRNFPLQTTIRKWSIADAEHVKVERAPRGTLMCEICGKSVKNNSELKAHQSSYHSDTKFSCSYCPKEFRLKCLLQNHERVHTGERPYQCPECPKAFKTYPAIRRHLLVHTGERKHVCTECGKAFQLSSGVKWHIRTAHLRQPWPKRTRARPGRDNTHHLLE